MMTRPTTSRITALRAFILAAAALALTPAIATASAALIIDSQGAITPAAEPLEELDAGASLTLAPDAEIIIMHYASCEEVHVKGGAVSVTDIALTLSDGAEAVSRTEIECPRKVEFTEEAGAAATVVLRGAGAQLTINPRPVFVVVGRSGVSRIEISRGGMAVGALTITGGVARWGAAPLRPGDYEVRFDTGDGPRRMPVAVTPGAGVTIIEP